MHSSSAACFGDWWLSHSLPRIRIASAIQEAAGPRKDSAYSVHRKLVHEGNAGLSPRSGWRCSCCSWRFWRGMFDAPIVLELVFCYIFVVLFIGAELSGPESRDGGPVPHWTVPRTRNRAMGWHRELGKSAAPIGRWCPDHWTYTPFWDV